MDCQLLNVIQKQQLVNFKFLTCFQLCSTDSQREQNQ
ncbi:hypothetical protein pb186bvf_009067 [Paramecium bursaria]